MGEVLIDEGSCSLYTITLQQGNRSLSLSTGSGAIDSKLKLQNCTCPKMDPVRSTVRWVYKLYRP